MSGHTPGDWIARPDPHGPPTDFCIGLDDDCSPVDYVAVCHARDARLIAAAPLQHAELIACKQFLEDMHTQTPEWTIAESQKRHEAVCAAIAAATGETP